jgi:hypothetical protein
MMTQKDRCQATLAMLQWLHSQDIRAGDAVMIMIEATAALLCSLAGGEKNPHEGAEITARMLVANVDFLVKKGVME